MCVMAWHWQPGESRQLSLWSNRDEWFSRPSQPLAQWPERPDWIGGRDLLAGGSWLLVDRKAGRLAALTNVRERDDALHASGSHQNPQTSGLHQNPQTSGSHRNPQSSASIEDGKRSAPGSPLSRGLLVAKVLEAGAVEAVETEAARYAGFNLLLIDWRAGKAEVLSNRSADTDAGAVPRRRLGLGPGSLSNGHPDTPWPKQRRLEAALEAARALDTCAWIQAGWEALRDPSLDAGLEDQEPRMLRNRPDPRQLAAVFVDTEVYGTCQSTLVQVDWRGRIEIRERTWVRQSASARGPIGSREVVWTEGVG